MEEEAPTCDSLSQVIVDENKPIAQRMRSVFHLKQIGGNAAIDVLATGLVSPSTLLCHEICYVLGQMQNPYAVPILTRVLADTKAHPIVRHEAAEAIGAIGLPSSLEILRKFTSDPHKEVSETCEVAVARIEHFIASDKQAELSQHRSIDPAPALPVEQSNVAQLRATLNDTKLPLFERYRAMFSLRDLGTTESVQALASGFADESALFRHEIAFVMGQMQHEAALESLKKLLSNPNEHAMVRHEAAESMGAIADPTKLPELLQFQSDPEVIVSQSCDVALDISEYWFSDQIDVSAAAGTALSVYNPDCVCGKRESGECKCDDPTLPLSQNDEIRPLSAAAAN